MDQSAARSRRLVNWNRITDAKFEEMVDKYYDAEDGPTMTSTYMNP
jgi:hypothetical protein